MDPGTALGVASLLIQVFSGCITGYNMFLEVVDMPERYSALRTRLRIEQSRLLIWGEKVGIAERILHESSNVLSLHRNLILDILFEVQTAFKGCLDVQTKYDPLVPESGKGLAPGGPSSKRGRLLRTIAIIGQPSRGIESLKWAMVKQDRFRALIDDLIHYNDRMEGLLDRSSLSDLHKMQQISNLMLLQLTSKVDALNDLALAMKIPRQHGTGTDRAHHQSQSMRDEANLISELADFKIVLQSAELDVASTELQIPFGQISMRQDQDVVNKVEGQYQQQNVWIEWRESVQSPSAKTRAQLESRVARLANLLGSERKPAAFRTPHCIGFTQEKVIASNYSRYGLVYRASSTGKHARPISLRELLEDGLPAPSLSDRLAIARILAECVLYLHAVDWIHKGIRSHSILFPQSSSTDRSRQCALLEPLIAGFDHARPDSPEEQTLPLSATFERILYRHPELITNPDSRSEKRHDIYSLGIVMIEIAFWQPIERLMSIKEGEKGSTRSVLAMRQHLMNRTDFGRTLEMWTGTKYASVVHSCIEGLQFAGEMEPVSTHHDQYGALLQEAFREQVMTKLQEINV